MTKTVPTVFYAPDTDRQRKTDRHTHLGRTHTRQSCPVPYSSTIPPPPLCRGNLNWAWVWLPQTSHPDTHTGTQIKSCTHAHTCRHTNTLTLTQTDRHTHPHSPCVSREPMWGCIPSVFSSPSDWLPVWLPVCVPVWVSEWGPPPLCLSVLQLSSTGLFTWRRGRLLSPACLMLVLQSGDLWGESLNVKLLTCVWICTFRSKCRVGKQGMFAKYPVQPEPSAVGHWEPPCTTRTLPCWALGVLWIKPVTTSPELVWQTTPEGSAGPYLKHYYL